MAFKPAISFKPSDADLAVIKKLDLKSPWTWLATVGGMGFCRPGPGTWGSLGAVPLGLLIYFAAGLAGFIVAFIIMAGLGFYATRDFEKQSGQSDSKMIVIDELLGMWIGLMPAFFMDGALTWLYVALAFVFFRIFDIFKPYPIRTFERDVKGAAGVIGDDIVAGQYTAICMIGLSYAGLL